MNIYKDGVKVDVTGIINNSDGVVNDVIDACCLINKKIYENPDSGNGWSWTNYDDSGGSQSEILVNDFQLGGKTINQKSLWGRPDCSGLTWMISQLMGYYFGSACGHIFKFIQDYPESQTGNVVRLITPEYDPHDWIGVEKSVNQWKDVLPYTSDWELITPQNGSTFASDGEDLQPGDLILKQGHIQIFGSIQNGKLYVWNWGYSTAIERTRDACMQILNQKLTGNDRIQALVDHNCEYSSQGDSITQYNYALRFKGFTNSQIMKFYLMDEEGHAKGNYRNPVIRVKQVKGGNEEKIFNSYQKAAEYLHAQPNTPGRSEVRYQFMSTNGSKYWTTVNVDTSEPECMYELIIEDGGDAIEIPGTKYSWTGTHLQPTEVFSGLHNLRALKINGPGVLRIDNNAFAGCNFLQTVILGDDTEWIGHQAFPGCVRLTTLDLKNVKIIGQSAFATTLSLSNIVIPDSCRLLYPNAFGGVMYSNVGIDSSQYGLIYPPSENSAVYQTYFKYTPECLKSVTIGSGLGIIPSAAFQMRYELETVNISGSVEMIEPQAFLADINLKNVNLNEGLKYILTSSFEYCTGLTSITLPKSVINMGEPCGTKLKLVDAWSQDTYNTDGIYTPSHYIERDYDSDDPDSTWNPRPFYNCDNLIEINCKNHDLTENAPWGATNATVNYI